MKADDLAAVARIQAQAYGVGLLEPDEVLRERLRAAPQTAWVALAGGCVQAYLSAYRSERGVLTRLHAPFHAYPAGRCLYLHDLAVAPAAAGRGLGQALVAHAWREGRLLGCTASALVAVQGAERFWQRLGYSACRPLASMAAALASYGPGAVYMARGLPP